MATSPVRTQTSTVTMPIRFRARAPDVRKHIGSGLLPGWGLSLPVPSTGQPMSRTAAQCPLPQGPWERYGRPVGPHSMAVCMVSIRHVRVRMPQGLVPVPVAVLTRRHHLVGMVVMPVVVAVRVFVLQRLVLMLVGV